MLLDSSSSAAFYFFFLLFKPSICTLTIPGLQSWKKTHTKNQTFTRFVFRPIQVLMSLKRHSHPVCIQLYIKLHEYFLTTATDAIYQVHPTSSTFIISIWLGDFPAIRYTFSCHVLPWVFGMQPAGKFSGYRYVNEYIQAFVLIKRYHRQFLQLNEELKCLLFIDILVCMNVTSEYQVGWGGWGVPSVSQLGEYSPWRYTWSPAGKLHQAENTENFQLAGRKVTDFSKINIYNRIAKLGFLYILTYFMPFYAFKKMTRRVLLI